MIQATCLVSMTKNHEVVVSGVTPIEAVLLCSEHHKGNGGCPVKVLDEPTTTRKVERIAHVQKIPRQVKGKTADGEDVEITVESDTTVYEDKVVEEDRNEDQEGNRLRRKYGEKKVDALFAKVRNLPKTFDEALKLGIGIKLPTNGMTEGSISETSLTS